MATPSANPGLGRAHRRTRTDCSHRRRLDWMATHL